MDVGEDGETKGKFIRTARKSQENKYKQPLIANGNTYHETRRHEQFQS